MTMSPMPAIALAAVPGRRVATLEVAQEVERRGFSGIYCASFSDCLALCEAIALKTERIEFGTSIANIYVRHVSEYARGSSFIHEISEGRFRFGVGVSHGAMNDRLGVQTGKPLTDMRKFVEEWRQMPRVGEQPPLVLAGLRDPMVRLAGEIAQGVVFANVARSRMAHTLGVLPKERREDPNFFIGNMIPICISDDEKAAASVNRKTLLGYVTLPNYREYWKAAGYVEEMEGVEEALARKDRDAIPALLSDRWLADTTLFGSLSKVREGVEAWAEAGVTTPILVPSSTSGGQMKALEELLAAFS